MYFNDAPTVTREIFTGAGVACRLRLHRACSPRTTYLLAGWAREQVCIYMCPWPRIQGAMFDEDSLVVTYEDWRGEPRGGARKGQSFEGRGHCVDCGLCVAGLPDRHRHPQRPADRLHRLRAVRRCLQHRDGPSSACRAS